MYAHAHPSAATDRPEPESLARLERGLRSLDPCGAEMSIVDLVLLASDATDDATEIGDLVDGLIARGAARILPREADPMLVRVPLAASEAA